MNVRRGLFRFWVIFACLFTVGVCAASSYAVTREFQKNREIQLNLARIRASGMLKVPCSVRGSIPFDSAGSNGLCGYEIAKFQAQYPEYRGLTEDRLFDRLCDATSMNVKSPFHP
jgi:hypothetical protein